MNAESESADRDSLRLRNDLWILITPIVSFKELLLVTRQFRKTLLLAIQILVGDGKGRRPVTPDFLGFLLSPQKLSKDVQGYRVYIGIRIIGADLRATGVLLKESGDRLIGESIRVFTASPLKELDQLMTTTDMGFSSV